MVILDNTTLTEFTNLYPPWQYLSVNFSHYYMQKKFLLLSQGRVGKDLCMQI